jgi:6-phosphogluconolactonase
MVPEIVVDSFKNLAEALAARVENEARRSLAARSRFAIALSGGSVGEVFFPRLSRAAVDWAAADFFWTDERAVPQSDPESNYRLARSLWLDPANVPPERRHPMQGDAPDLRAAAAGYADVLTGMLGTPPSLNLVLMGVGPDGHICSLFPGDPHVLEEKRWVAYVDAAPKPPRRRLTLTLPTLASAELVVVAAFGDAKARVVREALHEGEGSSLPVSILLRRASRALVLLDPPAACLLPT